MDSEQFELVISLRDHFNERINSIERAQVSTMEAMEKRLEARRDYIEVRLGSYEKAIDIARESMDTRLKSMNEFRHALTDQAARFITRDELAIVIGRVETDVKNLQSVIATLNNYVLREDMAMVIEKIEKPIDELQISRAKLEGKASQTSVFWSLGIAVLGLLIAAVTLITRYAPTPWQPQRDKNANTYKETTVTPERLVRDVGLGPPSERRS